jgi:hypothetical protein
MNSQNVRCKAPSRINCRTQGNFATLAFFPPVAILRVVAGDPPRSHRRGRAFQVVEITALKRENLKCRCRGTSPNLVAPETREAGKNERVEMKRLHLGSCLLLFHMLHPHAIRTHDEARSVLSTLAIKELGK